MSNYAMAVTLLAYALGIILVIVLIRFDRRLKRLEEGLLTLLTRMSQPRDDHKHIEEAIDLHPELEVGKTMPEHLDVALDQRGWILLMGLSASCETCARVSRELKPHLNLLSDYSVATLATRDLPREATLGHRVELSDEWTSGAPFMLLVDPDRVIQGSGAPSSGADVLEFLSEGEAHGYGPGIQHLVGQ